MPVNNYTKVNKKYFPVVLLIIRYKAVLFFEPMREILSVGIQMKATEQYFPVVLFIMPYKVFQLLSLWMKS